jgi:hypothetical protein
MYRIPAAAFAEIERGIENCLGAILIVVHSVVRAKYPRGCSAAYGYQTLGAGDDLGIRHVRVLEYRKNDRLGYSVSGCGSGG